MMAALFSGSGLVLLYIYAGYPALCRARARLQSRPYRAAAGFRPRVSVLVAAYNEEREIGRRILNIAAQEADFRFDVLVGSDGSSDATMDVAQRAAAEAAAGGVEVRALRLERGGKMATLAALLREARGEVIVFTDANSQFAAGALRAVVAPLADPSIGCAGGVKRISSGHEHTAGGEKSYWRLENRLKLWESSFGSCAGADGALYAVRRSDLPPLVTNRLLADDLYISLSVCTKERRCVIVEHAIAIEASDTTGDNELRRKARILAGALAAITQRRRLLRPGSGLSLTLWSHKVLRWFSFVPIGGMLIGAAGLPHPWAEALLCSGGDGGCSRRRGRTLPCQRARHARQDSLLLRADEFRAGAGAGGVGAEWRRAGVAEAAVRVSHRRASPSP